MRPHLKRALSPLLLKGMRGVCERGSETSSKLRTAVESDALLSRGTGLGAHLEGAMAVRPATSMAVALSEIRRASSVVLLSGNDVRVDPDAAVADLNVCRQKNDQCGIG